MLALILNFNSSSKHLAYFYLIANLEGGQYRICGSYYLQVSSMLYFLFMVSFVPSLNAV